MDKNKEITQLKFIQIDYNRILDISPNDIFNTWEHNKEVLKYENQKSKESINKLQKKLREEKEYNNKVIILNEINKTKTYINNLNRNFDIWLSNTKVKVNQIVKNIFKQYLQGINTKDLDVLSKKFGDFMAKDKNYNESLRNIIISFLISIKREHEESNKNKSIELIKSRQEINRYKQKREDIKTRIPPNTEKNEETNKGKFKMFYRQLVVSGDIESNDGESLELILLNFLDKTSKLLFNTSQDLISQLYRQVEERDDS